MRGRGSKRGHSNSSRKRKNSNHDNYLEKRQRSLDPLFTAISQHPSTKGNQSSVITRLTTENQEKLDKEQSPVVPLPIAVVPLGSVAQQPLAAVPSKPQGQGLPNKMPTAVDVRNKKNPTQGEHVDTGTSTSFIAPDFSLTSPIESADCSQFESTITPEDF